MSWQGQQRDAAAMVDFVAIRSAAEQVICPICFAPIGETCMNISQTEARGWPLVKVPAHDKRIKKARG